MTRPTRFCRVAWIVDDMDAAVEQFRDLFGMGMRFGPIAPDIIKAGIDEHGFEPIQLYVPVSELEFMTGLPFPLVEVALAVDDCEETFRVLAADGILPSFTSPLPGPDTQEHLYAQGFGGIPVMSCTDGDNESMMAPFLDLEQAAAPKCGVVTVAADDIDALAGRFTRYFGMQWAPADPAGLGKRALVGPHRVKLVERPSELASANAMQCVLASEIMVKDPGAVRTTLESAGHHVLAERTFASGRKGWYFGSVLAGMPVSIYDQRDDDEARGL
jgi:hypothetical protein